MGGTFQRTSSDKCNVIAASQGNEMCLFKNATIIAYSEQKKAHGIQLDNYTKKCQVNNCVIEAYNKSSSAMSAGIVTGSTDEVYIENTNINVSSENDRAVGIALQPLKGGSITVTNATIMADAKNNKKDGNFGVGIGVNSGSLTVYGGKITGTVAGIYYSPVTGRTADLKVYGGYFASCGYGGICFNQGNTRNAYVENATLAYIDYNGKYELTDNLKNEDRPSYIIESGSESTTKLINCAYSH